MSFDDSTISCISSGGGTCAINSITESTMDQEGKLLMDLIHLFYPKANISYMVCRAFSQMMKQFFLRENKIKTK
jgi:hypothetical protein